MRPSPRALSRALAVTTQPETPDDPLAEDGHGGGLDDLGLGPSALRVNARSLELPGGVCASFAVAGYPREVCAGWLEPLLTYPGRLDVSLHIAPVPPLIAAQQLRRQLARLESASRADAQRGRLADFAAEAAADDAAELAASLARGHGRLFRVGLYLTVHAPDAGELEDEVQRVRALAASLLLDAQPTTFRALQGWTSTLPLACDTIGARRVFDTAALAASFPFTSPDLQPVLGETPVLYGLNAYSSGVVVWDRFAQDNYNSVTLARSGAGKSYFTKLETLRLLYQDVYVAVIDPEDEYQRLCDHVAGTRIPLGAPGVCFNPFDLPQGQGEDTLIRRALFLQTLIAAMLGEPLARRRGRSWTARCWPPIVRAGSALTPAPGRVPSPSWPTSQPISTKSHNRMPPKQARRLTFRRGSPRTPLLRSGASGRRQLRHSDPASPSAPGHRPDHRSLRPHRRREDLPPCRRPRPRSAVRNRRRFRPGRVQRDRQPARASARHHRSRRARCPR
jgi:hypothetical protein